MLRHSFLFLYLQPDTTCSGRRTDPSSSGKPVWFFITFLRLSGWWRTQILKIHIRVCSLIYPGELYCSALFFFKSRITSRAENDLSLFIMRAKWQWWTQLFPHCKPLIMSTKLVPLQGRKERTSSVQRLSGDSWTTTVTLLQNVFSGLYCGMTSLALHILLAVNETTSRGHHVFECWVWNIVFV